MVDQGCDILQDDAETVLELAGILVALHQVANQPLLVHNVLANGHRHVLQLVDVDEEVLVDVLPLVDSLAVLRDLLAEELDHVRIEVDALVHYACEDGVAVGKELRHHGNLPLKFGETAERDIPQCREAGFHKDEGYGFHRIAFRTRHEEVGVGENRLLGFRET